MYYNNYIFIKTKRETKKPLTGEQSFYYFIRNSVITLLSDYSAYSFVFNCRFRLNPNLSPYFYLNTYGDMENVLNIVIKVSLVSEKNSKNKWNYKNCSNEDATQYYNDPFHFFDEINIQSEISEYGLLNLNRNTPVLLFSKLYSYYSNNYKLLKRILFNKSDKNGKTIIDQVYNEFHRMHKEIRDDNFYLAIMGMEYIMPQYVLYREIVKPIINHIKLYTGNETIDKYDNVSMAKLSPRLKTIYNIARYEIIRIAVDTGYSQGDYHSENFLLYEDIQEIMVIDFGNAKMIPKYKEIQSNWTYLKENNFIVNEHNFWILKEILTNIYNTHFIDSDKISKEYQWLKNIDEEDMETISMIHNFRLWKSSNQNTQIFDMYLSKNRSEYMYNSKFLLDNDNGNNCFGYFWKKIFRKR